MAKDLLGRKADIDFFERIDGVNDRAYKDYVKHGAETEARKEATPPWYVRLAMWTWTRGWRRIVTTGARDGKR